MSEISAYMKMFEDGSAFKKFDMDKIAIQQYAEANMSANADGKDVSAPLGDIAQPNHKVNYNSGLEEDHTDWSVVDEAMQKRMNSLRAKMKGKTNQNESDEIAKLKKRIKRLEEALMLVMETHEKLLS